MISNSGTSTLGLYDFKRQLDAFGGVDYFRSSLAGGYLLNARVMLNNGDIVKSTIVGNTNDPNVDMTGWETIEPKNIIKTVESIEDLMALTGMADGDVVFVKTKQGGNFTYNSALASESDGVVNFNGYIREFTGNIQSDWSGVVADATSGVVGTDCVPSMQRAIDAAFKYGVGVDFNAGVYRCVSLTYINAGYASEWYFFRLRPNVLINIPPHCTLIAADGTVASNADMQGTKGFIFFSDAKEDCPNAEVCGGGTLDHNGDNNLLSVINGWGNQSTTPTFLLTANSHNSKFHHLIIKNNSGHNHFINEKSTDTEFHHNTLYNFADSVVGNANCADHSAVYSRGKRCLAYNNIMINPRNSYVSTGFELHGDGCTAHTNYTKNVAVLGLGASYTTTDIGNIVTFKSNIGVGLVSAFAADTAEQCELIIHIKDNICNISGVANNPNDIYGRKGHDYITMREPNNAYMPKKLDIRDSGNTITWADPINWTPIDHSSCSAFVVRKVTSWISTNNTFINLKGSAINFGFQHVSNTSDMDSELSFSNKYINCGLSEQSAYDFTNDNIADGFSLIKKLTIDDVFEGCKWGAIYNNRAKIASYVFAPLVFNLKIRSDMYHDVMIGHQATDDLYCEYNIVMNQPSAGLTYKPLPIDNPVCGTIKINHGKSNKFMTFTKFIGLSRWKMKSLWFDQTIPSEQVNPFGDLAGDELDLLIYADNGATKLVCVGDGVGGSVGVWKQAAKSY